MVEFRERLGLIGTRKQNHTPESIRDAMIPMRAMYPDAGVREMIGLLYHEHGMSVSRYVTMLHIDVAHANYKLIIYQEGYEKVFYVI